MGVVAGGPWGAGRVPPVPAALGAVLVVALLLLGPLGVGRVAAADEPVPALPVSSADVQTLVGDYVRTALRAAVVDLEGRPASCYCAVAISVGLAGPANAVAAPGRAAPAAGAPTGATAAALSALARSGPSGDATALSVTGGGSASSSAVSGSTGAVTLLSTAPAAVAADLAATSRPAADPTRRTTTVDVQRLTAALRRLVTGLGAGLAAAGGADTDLQVHDLLAGVPDPAGPDAEAEVAAWDGGPSPVTDGTLRCAASDDPVGAPACALAVAVSATAGVSATVLPPRDATAGSLAGSGAQPGQPGMATAVSVAADRKSVV